MNKVPENIIFNVTGCLSEEAIRKYLSAELSDNDIRLIEMHLSDCPLCSDALEGFMELTPGKDIKPVLEEARTEIFRDKAQKLTVLKASSDQKKRSSRILYLSIAASIALLITGYFVIQSLVKTSERKGELALKEPAVYKNSKRTSGTAAKEETNAQNEIEVVVKKPQSYPLTNEATGSKYIRSDEAEKTVEIAEKGLGYYAGPAGSGKLRDKDDAGIADSVSGFVAMDAEITHDGNFEAQAGDQKNKTQVMPSAINNLDLAKDRTVVKADALKEAEVVTIAGKASNSRGNRKKEEKPVAGVAEQNGITVSQPVTREEINTGVDEYDKGNYSGAISRFEQVLKRDKNDQQSLYYCGMSYYYSKQYDKALMNLEKVVQYKNSSYYQSAKWQIAQIYSETNQPKQARKVFDEIIDEGGSYKKNAIDAIEKMENK